MVSHDSAVLHSIWGGRMDSNHPCLLHDVGGVNKTDKIFAACLG